MSKVDINELDLADVNDLLTELTGKPAKEKKVIEARAKLVAALTAKGMSLSTDDEGNFVLEAAKPAKAKAKPAPEPDEDEDEDEDETPPAKPAPKPAPKPAAKAKAKPAPEPDEDEDEDEDETPPAKPAAKAKAAKAKAAPEPDEDEDEDEEIAPAPKKAKKTAAADGAKRAPPPRDPKYAREQRIKILDKSSTFRPDSGRAKKWDIMLASKTVGDFLDGARDAELATPSSYLGMCVKTGKVSVI